jgi:hypothetical protein
MFTKKWLDAIVYLAADQWLEDGEETLGLYASIFSHSWQVELELLRFLCERIVKREKVKVSC